MAAPARRPKPKPPRRRKPPREYVVEDSTPEDTPEGIAAVEAWLTAATK